MASGGSAHSEAGGLNQPFVYRIDVVVCYTRAYMPMHHNSDIYIYNLIYTLTLERPLVYGVIQKNGILARAHLFLWSVPFFENHDLC